MTRPATVEEALPEPLDPRTAPVPRYGQASLADLLPAVLAGQGVHDDQPTRLTLEPADRVCVFLVDGMGWQALRDHPAEAPFLTSLLSGSAGGTGEPITAGFPSTTATSLASVGTGLVPGKHGLAGYTVLDPDAGQLMNQLRWQPWTDPYRWQPFPTVFQRAQNAGIETSQVSAPHFQHTPLTKIALSGGTFLGRLSGEERMDLAAARLAASDRALVYTYYADLDGNGHRYGVDSAHWRQQLRYVDGLARRLAEQLPPRSALYVTADHGMVDVPEGPESRLDFDEDWELGAGVARLGGEGRARHVYAVPGATADVYAVWREVLADQAWVATRDEAIELGWFGPADAVADRVRPRLGDVVVAMTGNAAIIASRNEPNESALVGMHGSMTPAEQLVPLLQVRT
ncbi:alkaline phosphatase family protein [Streptomyces alkaliterrae]|uniref:Alkaline phosphatase family protein n=1 Tax=Streptomyces alkaliterrae TaxID=2213162 RepID=A0A5P0YKB4_9ACTN|nr:nucleotide pyrophosphatase/phosphodiesterase family protein [Streptomyces alkaliterrae]MBB1252247.1 alkaline phosphatase family protein [Streptomyces alkaliterrae]MBB1258777.1 alkaline phosphatase family protein [Streptomyces alkaliterrae]MQS00813.1 alkaline phosphatase family protein [Streptomyces alkaliterrae]